MVIVLDERKRKMPYSPVKGKNQGSNKEVKTIS
jgi:hypothetical protein